MWNIFAADVASHANKLPAELKARLIYLAEFTQVHTRRVLAGEATVDALLDVNTAVMRGLRGEGA
ncbi:flagellar biosynthesis regulator FlaF [Jhaorihella thermophila]